MQQKDQNPYISPKSNVADSHPAGDSIIHSRTEDMSADEIKKLNKFSSDINILGFFAFLCAAGSVMLIYQGFSEFTAPPFWPAALLVCSFATAYSAFRRPSWGRPVCIIASLLILPGFPFGTFVGYIAIRASLDGMQLFGRERISGNELGEAIAKIERRPA